MPRRKPVPKLPARLPNAPLSEAVFELRWELSQGPIPGPLLNYDPMLLPLLHKFTAAAEAYGFPHAKDLSHPTQTPPYSVLRRFYKDADQPFPLMQLGPGIFAVNQSALYEWKSFKEFILGGTKLLLDSYPNAYGAAVRPIYLELRYVDVFDKSITGSSSDIFKFSENCTSLQIKMPPVLDKKQLYWGDTAGRFVFRRSIRGIKDSHFEVDLASGTEQPVVQLTSKMSTGKQGVPVLGDRGKFSRDLGKWLAVAHDSYTSPFFKEFVAPETMRKFGKKK
jgi:hypothetical protein